MRRRTQAWVASRTALYCKPEIFALATAESYGQHPRQHWQRVHQPQSSDNVREWVDWYAKVFVFFITKRKVLRVKSLLYLSSLTISILIKKRAGKHDSRYVLLTRQRSSLWLILATWFFGFLFLCWYLSRGPLILISDPLSLSLFLSRCSTLWELYQLLNLCVLNWR